MTRCLTCWRESKSGPRCDTCTKGDGLNAPMKPWDGSHPPPKEEDETMTYYTERFRTLSIPQMQQVLAVCVDYVTKLSTTTSETRERIGAILSQAPSFNIDPADEALVDDAMAKREAGLNVTPMTRASGDVIRNGHLVAGKRYREPAGLETFVCTELVCPKLGEICSIRQTSGWLSLNSDGFCGYVTAVELVEDDAQPRLVPSEAAKTPPTKPWDEGGRDEYFSKFPGDERLVAGLPPERDPTIIRAAEGVTLEPGEYEPVSRSGNDRFRREQIKSARHATWDGNHWRFYLCGVLYTAVRRIDPKPASEPAKCPRCGSHDPKLHPAVQHEGEVHIYPHPFHGPASDPCNHSGEVAIDRATGGEICCDCSASAGEPVAPAAGGDRAIVVGSTWATRDTGAKVEINLVDDEVRYVYIVGARVTSHRREQDFRDNFRWVSDPAPPQQPAERVEQVAHWCGISVCSAAAVDGTGFCPRHQPEKLSLLISELANERDAALATIAKLTAELADERAKHEDLRRRAFQTIDHRNRIEDALEDKLESARAGLNPKACGELIATVTQGVGTANQLRASAAFAALNKLAAMLGVEVAIG